MTAQQIVNQLADTYAAAAPGLPGAAEAAVVARRSAAFESFRRFGIPTQKLEGWKFTGLTALERHPWSIPANDGGLSSVDLDAAALTGPSHRLVFVNGRFDAVASRIGRLPAGIMLAPLSAAGAGIAELLGQPSDRHATALADLNAALASDGMVLNVDDGVILDQPVEIVCFGAPGLVNLRHHVSLGRGAQVQLCESYVGCATPGPGWTNVVLQAMLGAGASLNHVRLQGEGASVHHAALGMVTVAAGARYDHVSIQAGGNVARHELDVNLAGSGAHAALRGLVLARGEAHIDHTLRLHHAAPECTSEQLFKHAVDGRGHAVFQGGIRVFPYAQKTDARQLSRTLLLSDQAQIDTKPELEILADDVKCSHGASIGDVDAEQIFYMQARGIGATEARRLLLDGFAREIVEAVAGHALRARVDRFVAKWLMDGTAA